MFSKQFSLRQRYYGSSLEMCELAQVHTSIKWPESESWIWIPWPFHYTTLPLLKALQKSCLFCELEFWFELQRPQVNSNVYLFHSYVNSIRVKLQFWQGKKSKDRNLIIWFSQKAKVLKMAL